MTYEELISELCIIIKESEYNAERIYDDTQSLQNIVNSLDLDKENQTLMNEKLSNVFSVLQHQDLHRQKIERVVNLVCDKNGIDKSKYNFSPSENINHLEDNLDQSELDELIKKMNL